MTSTAFDRLAELETLEHRAVDLLARGGIRTDIRAAIVKGLGQLRLAKARLLGSDRSILRKSSAAPAPAQPAGRRVLELMHHRGMTLHHATATGTRTIDVPHNGRVVLEAGDHQGRQFLLQRGFKDCGELVEDVGKASTADIAQFRTSNLQRLTTLPFAGARST